MSGPVIAISGPPGAGKTALSQALAERLQAGLVEYDRFETMTRQPPDRIMDWLARGAPYGEISAPGLDEAVARAAARGCVVFDTMLGRAQPGVGGAIDFAVWIDLPLDIALARKIAQLSGSFGRNQPSEFIGWLGPYLSAYEGIVHPACVIQRQRLVETADMVVDGRAPLNQLVGEVAASVNRQFSLVF